MKIVVNKDELEKTAGEIDRYIASMGSQNMVDTAAIAALAGQWQGADSTVFIEKWKNTQDNDKFAQGRLKNALKAYAEILRYASGVYKDAQYNAVKKAHKI